MTVDPLTSPEADALRAQICAAPDEDAPRLAYADWLDDNGNETWRARADFIRMQVHAARSSPNPSRPRQPATADRLLFTHYERWWEEVPAWLRATDRGPAPAPTDGYRRGFVASFLQVGELWLRGREEPVRAPIEELELWFRKSRKADVLSELGDVPQLGTVHRLTVCFDDPAGLSLAAAALGRSPHAGRLRSLTLWGPTDPEAALALKGARSLGRLTHLTLTASSVPPSAPSQPRGWSGISRLTLLSPTISAAGPLVEILAGDSALPGLRSVELDEVGNPEELIGFVRSAGLRRLQTLRLGGCAVTDDVALALAASPHATGLRSLALRHTRLTDIGLLAIANCPHLSRLTELDLHGCYTGWGTPAVPIGRQLRNRLLARFPFVKLDQ